MIGRNTSPPPSWPEERAALLVDLDQWKQRALRADAELENARQERQQQAEVMEAMKAELDVLKRHVFGQRSEKMPPVDRELRRTGKTKRDPEKERQRRKDNKG